MKGNVARLDTAAILRGLKDFQRDTVEYVFGRLYGPNATSRFLVADEVGLGKTLVARGVIAKAIDHLWEKKDRIDVVYICSNGDIARQNVNRLNVTRQQEFTHTSRITLLPTQIKDLQKNPLNFISLTPGTSFDLKSSLGNRAERVLLYRLLEKPWNLRGAGPKNVFQGNCTKDSFRDALSRFGGDGSVDTGLAKQFTIALDHHMGVEKEAGHATLGERFEDLCERFRHARSSAPSDDRYDRARWIGEVRTLLAASCLRALKPDLIILDEFQRFKDLLAGESELGQLASDLFEYEDVKILLLSATPYKMYTLAAEAQEDNHYADFVRTLKFLQFDPAETEAFTAVIDDYRRELFRLGTGAVGRLAVLKADLESRLRRVVVRTERLAVTEDRDGMLREVSRDGVQLTAGDVAAYPKLRRVAASLEAGDVMDFWKSAPFLLNFMEEYEIKRSFTRALEVSTHEDELAKLLADAPELLLRWKDIAAYAAVDPRNAGLRKLMAETVGAGAWQLLWVPPSLPYYRPAGPFADPKLAGFTKRLVFSAWRVVPKTLTCLLSYEAERAMMCAFESAPVNTPEERKRRRPLLRFARSDGRLTGMPVLALVYPSVTLAEVGDPLPLANRGAGGGLPTTAEVRLIVAEKLRHLLSALPAATTSATPDEAWYWAAPLLLDLKAAADATNEWFDEEGRADVWTGERAAGDEEGGDAGESLWHAHVEHARSLLRGEVELGSRPDDLAEVLADIALAGPGVTALRALARVSAESGDRSRVELRNRAGQIGHAVLHLFNLPEVTAMIRGRNGQEPYWRRVLKYGVDGCVQAVLDEYAHIVRDLQGLTGSADTERVTSEVAETVIEALSLRTSSLGMDDIRPNAKRGTVRVDKQSMRGRFALRFGEERSDDAERGATRSEQVREAFNSPFWPFVLATTSVGQEGLDFHPYCHAVVHWNLPSNPVDLEQREGRVHRYKGHAVRKNLASKFGVQAAAAGDPWDALFDAGVRDRVPGSSDLVPFWVYPLAGGAVIERHVIALPLSRDAAKMEALRRTLAVYRMVFGQCRQDDLISYLLTQFAEHEIGPMVEQLRVDLAPPRAGGGTADTRR